VIMTPDFIVQVKQLFETIRFPRRGTGQVGSNQKILESAVLTTAFDLPRRNSDFHGGGSSSRRALGLRILCPAMIRASKVGSKNDIWQPCPPTRYETVLSTRHSKRPKPNRPNFAAGGLSVYTVTQS
jgi:hypothetical protein